MDTKRIALAACFFASSAVAAPLPTAIAALPDDTQTVAMLTVAPPAIRRRPAQVQQPGGGADQRVGGAVIQRVRPEFQLVRIMAADGAGVCSIRVTGHTFTQDRWGGAVRFAFDAAQDQLTATYGPLSEMVDNLRMGAYYAAPEEWVEAVFRNERIFEAAWAPQTPLYDDVTAITLTVRAVNKNDAYLSLQYRFANHKC